MKKQILIVTRDFDNHADLVLMHLRTRGHDPLRINLSDVPMDVNFTLEYEDSVCKGVLRTPTRTISSDSIGAIWWRREGPIKLPDDLSPDEKYFARKEIRESVKGFFDTVECYWMSHPSNLKKADYKLAQLKYAQMLGFEIPRTIVTTKGEEVKEFYEKCGRRIVYKTISGPLAPPPHTPEEWKRVLSSPEVKHPYTALISRETLDEYINCVQHTPCLFQEYIDKLVELRVTVIGNHIFAAELDTQAHESTIIDSRHYSAPVKTIKANLPPQIAEKCFALVKKFGLNFSAIDLILTPDGRYVFLESNPNGQWAYIEEKVPELKMIETLSNCLVAGSSD